MAASYDHRVHLNASDMPAMHLVQLAGGSNCMGYYMYHGGQNPHSLYRNDAPENTLQASAALFSKTAAPEQKLACCLSN